MGRRPTVNLTLPPGMRARRRSNGKTYYYYDTGKRPRKELPLGLDYVQALKKYAEVETTSAPDYQKHITFRYVAERYVVAVLPGKALRTRKDNLAELNKLYQFFDNPPAPLDEIEPQHIARYRDWRKVTRSTQELALFSHIWNWAREQGYTARPNPTIGVRRNRSKGRSFYADDDVFKAVYEAADQPLRDAMDLAYLAAQRPADTLAYQRTDIRNGELHVEQRKTKTRRRLVLTDAAGRKTELGQVVDRILARKAKPAVHSLALVVNERGQPLTYAALDYRFEKARSAAATAATRKSEEATSPPEKEALAALAAAIRKFQFRDLRAKAATEKDDLEGMSAAKDLLGHASETMTRQYVRHRLGKRVNPVK